MSGIKIYYHPYCLSSYKLLKSLKEKELIDKATLINTGIVSIHTIDKLLYSVPSIEYRSHIVDIDPISYDLLYILLSNENDIEINVSKYIFVDEDKIINRIKETIVSSSYISLYLLYVKDFDSIRDTEFIKQALRINLLKALNVRYDQYLDNIKNVLSKNANIILEEIIDKLKRAVAYNYLREQLMASNVIKLSKDEIVGIGEREIHNFLNKHSIKAWIIAKISKGRILLPYNTTQIEQITSLANTILDILKEKYQKYIEYLANETTKIYGDKEYFSLINK